MQQRLALKPHTISAHPQVWCGGVCCRAARLGPGNLMPHAALHARRLAWGRLRHARPSPLHPPLPQQGGQGSERPDSEHTPWAGSQLHGNTRSYAGNCAPGDRKTGHVPRLSSWQLWPDSLRCQHSCVPVLLMQGSVTVRVPYTEPRGPGWRRLKLGGAGVDSVQMRRWADTGR